MDEPTMKRLYEYNMSFDKDEEHTSTSRKHKQKHPECWGGFGLRLMLMLLYTVSMLCLLRYDEALRITWNDVHFEQLSKGLFPFRVRLDLPFRKTHQHGGMSTCNPSEAPLTVAHAGIAPFYLYADPQRPWMCPVRLFARWWDLCDGSKGGYVFRRKSGSRFSDDPFAHMVSRIIYAELMTADYPCRHLNLSWNASETTSATSSLIHAHMALIHSAVVAVNILPWCCAGPSARSAAGEVGQRTSTTLVLSSNTSYRGQTPR
jgi:hypothetical protein